MIIHSFGGIGDQILGFQCAQHCYPDPRTQNIAEVIAYCRQEIFEFLEAAFTGNIDFSFSKGENINETELFKSPLTQNEYYVTPDALFLHPYSFDYNDFAVSLKTLISTRLLTHVWSPEAKIFVGLSTTQPVHAYREIGPLLNALGEALPGYEIIVPLVGKWGDTDLNAPRFDNLPLNVEIIYDAPATVVVNHLKTSCYGVFVDNGLSHLAFQYGMPRLVLDGFIHQLAHIVRWREDVTESIPLNTRFDKIASIVKQNVEVPQSQLVDRKYLLGNEINWREALIFKW